MAQKKGRRDWSEWKEHVTGMHRLDKGFDQRNLTHRNLQTQTGISLRDLDLEEEKKEPSILVWVLVFVGMLIVRAAYFELTKQDRVKSSTRISRGK